MVRAAIRIKEPWVIQVSRSFTCIVVSCVTASFPTTGARAAVLPQGQGCMRQS